MALKFNFYNEIFENERKWIDEINNNLLNSIYCKLALKPFYVEKKNEIEVEYNTTNNQMLKQILTVIDNIIFKIDEFSEQHEDSKSVNIKDLLPLFLTNQLSNNKQKENESIDLLKKKKQFIENEIRSCIKERSLEDNEYLYDDFPVETKKVI